jgi:hypothetical protein
MSLIQRAVMQIRSTPYAHSTHSGAVITANLAAQVTDHIGGSARGYLERFAR